MLTLRPLGDAETRLLYEHRMKRDFPLSELKSLSAIQTMREKGIYDVLGAYDDGTFAAYALMYCPKEGRILLLDYLAVEPELRGRGIGSTMMGLLRAYYAGKADALMIECERPKAAPDEQTARKRIRFYVDAGAMLTNVRIWLFEVEYSILVFPCGQHVEQKNWAGEMLSLYRQMLPPAVFERNVRLIRG